MALNHQINKSTNVATIILAGGQGTRLYPLTQSRCKPAVTFGGRYRLIDIPISNSLNSDLSNIFVITQAFASILNQHIKETFRETQTHIEILSPEERGDMKVWYKGTADAVRQNLNTLLNSKAEYFLILSGDQLYNMDLRDMLKFARKKKADLTIAALPVEQKEAKRFGLLKIDEESYVLDFAEKPSDLKVLKRYQVPKTFNSNHLRKKNAPYYLASMGIYIFKREALVKLLTECPDEDFGKHLIPYQIKTFGKTAVYLYEGYWEDIGTISSFYEANLALTKNKLGLNLYDEACPIYAQHINLPCPYISNTKVSDSIIGPGSIIEAKEVTHSMLGLRTHILDGTVVRDAIILGNQHYLHNDPSELPYIIGKNCLIQKAIIDENVTIGNNVILTNRKGLQSYDGNGVYIRDGIIVVTSGTTIPDNFKL